MKNIFFIAVLFCAQVALAKPVPVPEEKPKIPEMAIEDALPADLDAEAIPMPEKIPSEAVAATAVKPILCNADAFDKLAVGTKIYIRIFGHEEISRETIVGPKGTVTIPMVGEVLAEGETTKTLAARIAEQLETAYVISQGVDVEIVQYPPIYVIGQVAKPGLYDYRPRLTVRQAMALAGGVNSRGRTSQVRILRNAPGNPLMQEEHIGDEDSQVLPGDTVEVLRSWF